MTTIVRQGILSIASDTAITNISGLTADEMRAQHAEYRAQFLAAGMIKEVKSLDIYSNSPLVNQETFMPEFNNGKHFSMDVGMIETSRGLDHIWCFSFCGSASMVPEVYEKLSMMTIEGFIHWLQDAMKATFKMAKSMGMTSEEAANCSLIFVTLHGEMGCYTILPRSAKQDVFEHFDDSDKTFVSGTGMTLFKSPETLMGALMRKDWEEYFTVNTHLTAEQIVKAAAVVDQYTNDDVQFLEVDKETYKHWCFRTMM